MIHPVYRELLHPFAPLPTETRPAPAATDSVPRLISFQSRRSPSTLPAVVTAPQTELGALLRAARHRLGLTQEMVADFAQVGLSTIRRAEKGVPIRMDSIYHICQFFTERFGRPVTAEDLGLLRDMAPNDRIRHHRH